VTVPQPDHSALLDPVVAAIDALLATRPRAVVAAKPAQDAKEFLEFKLYAALHTCDQVRAQLPAAATSLGQEAGSFTVAVDYNARFVLFVLVDSFLFEAGSVRDAVAQLANAVFETGVAMSHVQLGREVLQRLNPGGTGKAGLEAWFEEADQPAWLRRLFALRNGTTHRHVVRLPEQFQWKDAGTDKFSFTSRVHVEAGDGKYEPLQDFIDRAESGVCALLVESLKRLAEVEPPVR